MPTEAGGGDGSVRRTRLTVDEQLRALALWDKGLRAAQIARRLRRSRGTVYRFLRANLDTVELAKREVRAKALDLTRKVLRRADTGQLIDILSRPNVAVFEPAKAASPMQFGIVVSPSSCGAVHVSDGRDRSGEIPSP